MKKIYFLINHFLRYPFYKIKKNWVHHSARLSRNVLMSNSKVGMGTYIACNVVINNTEVGNYCSIAPGVQIGGMQHSYWWFSTSPRLSKYCISNNRTKIGNDVWIAAGSIIKQGVTIGDGAVIGAMSFVNEDVPENSIYFGIPAKPYKKRLDDEIFEVIKESGYWNLNEKEAQMLLDDLDKRIEI